MMRLRYLVALLATCFAGAPAAQAATSQTWTAGTNTWDANTTADWSGAVWNNSNNRNTVSDAFFNGTAGTVTVDDSRSATPVTFGYMEFKGGSGWVISGGVLDNVEDANNATVVKVDAGVGNVTISSLINVAPNPTNGSSTFTNLGVGSTLKLGNINISSAPQSGTNGNGTTYTNQSAPFTYINSSGGGQTVSSQTVQFFAKNGTTIELDGNYTSDAGLSGGLVIGNYNDSTASTGTYILNGALSETPSSSKAFDFGSGNIVLGNSSLGTGAIAFVGNGGGLLQTLLTSGSQTISNGIYAQSKSNAQIGGLDNSVSTYSGTLSAGSGQGALDLHAGTNGTVTFSNVISGSNGSTIKSGAGTVILKGANTWTSYLADVFEMKAGTTLVENTTGDAFGNGAATGGLGTLYAQVDAGATLGGMGSTAKEVVAAGATSVLAPGLAGSVGQTLKLSGGVVATSGLTMNFTLNGAGADNNINLGSGVFTLGGTVTINLAALNYTLALHTPYTLITGTGAWSQDPATSYVFTVPNGYKVESYSISSGTGTNSFQVEITVAPEPETWAALLLGCGALLLVARRRLVRA